MTAGGLTRRQWLGLGALSVGAVAASRYVQSVQPVGSDVSEAVDIADMSGARGFPTEGAPNAPLTMLVFSDYACGVCRRAEPRWRAAAREAGGVRLVYRDWPVLGPPSERAARVALAADRQGVHARFHAALIRSGRLDDAGLRAALAEAGGDWGRLTADVATNAAAIDGLLARTARDAFQLGFRGTPSFLIGAIRIEGGAEEGQFRDAMARARGG